MAWLNRLAVVGLSACCAVTARAGVQYRATDLGAFTSDFNYSQGNGVNDAGQAVGTSKTTTSDRAVVWSGDAKVMTDLQALPEMISSTALGINDVGQIVGSSRNGDRFRAFLWQPVNANASDGTLLEITGLPGERNKGRAAGINAMGQIVGTSGSRAFLWTPAAANGTNGTAVSLDSLGGGFGTSAASSVNNLGSVVGFSSTIGGANHAFLWTPTTANGSTGSMIDLATLPGAVGDSFANGVNDAGQVVGRSVNATFGERPTRWTVDSEGTVTASDLGDFAGGSDFGAALGINKAGQIVGFSNSDEGDRAFIWTEADGMIDLNTLLDPTSAAQWSLSFASSISDNGQIVGWGTYDPDGAGTAFDPATRGFILNAVPEPTAGLAVLALGAVGAMRARRRR